jgi:hypothetical protein
VLITSHTDPVGPREKIFTIDSTVARRSMVRFACAATHAGRCLLKLRWLSRLRDVIREWSWDIGTVRFLGEAFIRPCIALVQI